MSITCTNCGQDITREYVDGIIEGIKRYAWWKCGVQYVGTTGETLKQAIEDVEKEYKNKGQAIK